MKLNFDFFKKKPSQGAMVNPDSEVPVNPIDDASINPDSKVLGDPDKDEGINDKQFEIGDLEGTVMEADFEQVKNESFMDKFREKMKGVYEKAVDAKTYKNFSEKVSSLTWEDAKNFLTKERESQIVMAGGKIGYDTVSTYTGTKAITDWALYLLHKFGLKSSIKGDVHKFFAENDMERALVGITNQAIEMKKNVQEGKKADVDSEKYQAYRDSKDALNLATAEFKSRVEDLNVSEEKKKQLRQELALIMKDHKKDEAEICKGQSEQFQQAMRKYTGNKVNAFKLGKDAVNSALTLSGFMALRGVSYLGFSALERGKEAWGKYSRDKYEAKKKVAIDPKNYPDWKNTYDEVSWEKRGHVLKSIVVGSAKETYNKLIHGRKESALGEAEIQARAQKAETKEKELGALKKQLEDEGKGVFGKTWRVAWHKIKNIDPETVKENLTRLQAVGELARVFGVSLTGYQAYETDGSMFKGAYDRLVEAVEKDHLAETIVGNMYVTTSRMIDSPENISKLFGKIKEGIAGGGVGAVINNLSDTVREKYDNLVNWNASGGAESEADIPSHPMPKEQEVFHKIPEYQGKGVDQTTKGPLADHAVDSNVTSKGGKAVDVKGGESHSKESGKSLEVNTKEPVSISNEDLDKLIKTGDGKGLKKFIEDNADITEGKRKDGKSAVILTLKPDARVSQEQVKKTMEALMQKNKDYVDMDYVVKKAEAAPIGSATAEAAPISIKMEKGDSIWSLSRKALTQKFGDRFAEYEKGDPKVAEALMTYDIDKLKDVIEKNPSDFGLPKNIDFSKMTAEQLKQINFEEAFKRAFPDGNPVNGLTEKQVNSIVGHNEELRRFFRANPQAPRTSENYEAVLHGKGLTGRELPKIKGIEPLPDTTKIITPIEPISEPEPEMTTMNTPADLYLEEDLNEKVFDHWSDILGSDEEKAEIWKELSAISVKDAFEGKFPVVGDVHDSAEIAYADNLQEYIAEVKAKNDLEFKPNETVRQFLTRAARENERSDRLMEIGKNRAQLKDMGFEDSEDVEPEQKAEGIIIESDLPESHISKINSGVKYGSFNYEAGKLTGVNLISNDMHNLNLKPYLVNSDFSINPKQEFELQKIAAAREVIKDLNKLGIPKNSVEYLGVQKELKNIIEDFKKYNPGVLDEKKALGEDVVDREVRKINGENDLKVRVSKKEAAVDVAKESVKGIGRKLFVEEGKTEPKNPTIVRHKIGVAAKEQIIIEEEAQSPVKKGLVSDKAQKKILEQQAVEEKKLSKVGKLGKIELPNEVVIDEKGLNMDEVEEYREGHVGKKIKRLSYYFDQIKNDKNISKEEKYAVQELIKEKAMTEKLSGKKIVNLRLNPKEDSGKKIVSFRR